MSNYTIANAVQWQALSAEEQKKRLQRPAQQDSAELIKQVEQIIEQVRVNGDQALLELTARFDKVRLDSPLLELEQVRQLAAQCPADVQAAIDTAYQTIKAFHQAQQPSPITVTTADGVQCEQRFAALEKVGLYIPGGSASLPSTVLMCGVPAQIAGCKERVLISPPNAQGQLNPSICYAALKCGVTQVAMAGGAQAIAALAFGTDQIAAVDKIFGPGNSYVTAAKQYVSQLAGGPAIDLPAGPSELLIIADESAEPAFIAADLLSQAEHGPDSQVILLSPSAAIIEATREALAAQLAELPRAAITAQALASSSFIQTQDLAEAAAISQAYAPEHLSLQVNNAADWIEATNKAGSIFVGHYAPESGGDYATGTNHVLPTYGHARNYSSLGLADFYRRYTVQTLTPQGLTQLAEAITVLAAEEGLDAHRLAVTRRLQSERMAQDLATTNKPSASEQVSLAQQLLRPHLRGIEPYASARRSMSGGAIWLNANESPYSADYRLQTDNLNRYPNFQSQPLNQAYADYAGVKPEQVLSHRGSDESIELLIRSFCEPGRDRIMVCPPTYGMYKISAGLNNTPVVTVPLQAQTDEDGAPSQEAWQLDVAQMKNRSAGVKLVFLCNPSNPLGNLLDPQSIEAVLKHFAGQALVVVDEAYIEYAEIDSYASKLAQYDNLVVMRTMSKAFGLAGIRVGFTLANEAVIRALVPVLAPYPLPDMSIQIAQQALQADNRIQVRQNVLEAQGERQRLHAALESLPYINWVQPSATNFILFQLDAADALMAHCQQAGILLRNQSSQLGLDNCLRVTVGAPAENEQLIAVLQRFDVQGFQNNRQTC